jgi:crotonobetaine/carnitine-CoA ligase
MTYTTVMSDPVTDPLFAVPRAERTTVAALAKQVALRPNKVALVGGDGEQITYAETSSRAYAIASGLRRLGVERQDSVLLYLDSNPDNVLVWLGTTVGSMVSAPINTAFKGDMLAYVIDQSQSQVLVIEGAWCDRLASVADRVPNLRTVIVRGTPNVELPPQFTVLNLTEVYDSNPEPFEPPLVSDVATMVFTSGTEGRSKGVMCPHGHVFTMATYPPLQGPDEVMFVALPLFHVAGLLSGVFNALRCGGTAVIPGGFSASKFWDQIRGYGCTSSILLGGMMDFLRMEPPGPRDRDHPLRFATVLPAPADAVAVTERFGFAISSAYGLTETGTVMCSNPATDTPGSCGRPRPFLQVRLVDENDNDVAPGEAGEILMRSTEPWTFMAGYHGMPEETVRVTRDMWLHSGDVVRMDPATGEYYYIDRRKDSLRRRGENVSSFEVEKHLLDCPEVAEAAVVAVASEYSEDELKAVLVLHRDAAFDPATMLRDLYERMPYFMVPRYYEVTRDLPRTATHKVMKQPLRARGITPETWDAEAHGFRITRDRLIEPARDRA